VEKRINFNSEKSRDKYFKDVLITNNLSGWNELSLKFGIPRATLSKYRIGKLTLPVNLYRVLSANFSDYNKIYFLKETSILDDNWGQIKGGIKTYSSHKEIFEKGREKAIKRVRELVHRFDINIKLDNALAYFIGLFIAEGFTNKYQGYYLTQFTGHWQFEHAFYDETIRKIADNLFSLKPYIRHDSLSNAVRFNLYSRDLFTMITERFKISRGRKSYTVLIPDEILNADKEILFSCISGIYDGESCFFVDKRKKYNKPYPRIDLHMVNPTIIKQIYEILIKNGIKCSISGNYVRIYIYGDKNISDFLNKIGFQNPKHINKVDSYFGNNYISKKLI